MAGRSALGKARARSPRFSHETVIVDDFRTSSLREEFQAIVASYGLRACWSAPILSRERRVLGTFALYFGEPRSPSQQDRETIEQFRDLASIAIERTEAENALRRSRAHLAKVQRLSLTGSFSWRPATGAIVWSEETYRIYGLDPTVRPTMEVVCERVHPADLGSSSRRRSSRSATERTSPSSIVSCFRTAPSSISRSPPTARAWTRTSPWSSSGPSWM